MNDDKNSAEGQKPMEDAYLSKLLESGKVTQEQVESVSQEECLHLPIDGKDLFVTNDCSYCPPEDEDDIENIPETSISQIDSEGEVKKVDAELVDEPQGPYVPVPNQTAMQAVQQNIGQGNVNINIQYTTSNTYINNPPSPNKTNEKPKPSHKLLVTRSGDIPPCNVYDLLVSQQGLNQEIIEKEALRYLAEAQKRQELPSEEDIKKVLEKIKASLIIEKPYITTPAISFALIRKHRVELKLLTTLGTKEVYKWLPTGHRQGNFFNIQNYSIVTKTHLKSYTEMTKALHANAGLLHEYGKLLFGTAAVLENLGSNIDALSVYIERLLVSAQQLQQHDGNLHSKIKYYLGDILKDGERYKFPDSNTQLLSLYAAVNNITEDIASQELAKFFSIPDSIYDEPRIDGRTSWFQFKETPGADFYSKNNDEVVYRFLSINQKMIGQIAIKKSGTTLFLQPTTYWSKTGCEKHFELCVPFSKPYPLYNLPQLYRKENLPVFLTEDLEIAAINQKNDLDSVWISWFGEEKTAYDVDWSHLKGRVIYYFMVECTERSETTPELLKSRYKTGLFVLRNLKDIAAKLLFVDCQTIVNYQKDYFTFAEGFPQIMTADEFEKKAESEFQLSFGKRNYTPPSQEDIYDVPELDYLLFPGIMARKTTLLYADSGTGKTWVGLSIAYAIATGCKAFGDWTASRPRKVLYVDSEMGSNSIKRRLQIITKIYSVDKNDEKPQPNKNFSYETVDSEKLNLLKEEDRRQIERYMEARKTRTKEGKLQPVELLVLDNLSTLSDFRDTDRSWSILQKWFKELNLDGCAVLLIHHSSKDQKSQRGTGSKLNTVEAVIHLKSKVPPGLPKIGMTFTSEKNREAEPFLPFTIKLEGIRSDNPKWEIVKETMTRVEKDEFIMQRYTSGASAKDIATLLGVQEITIYKRIKLLRDKYRSTIDIIEGKLESGRSIRQISGDLNISEKEVWRYTQDILEKHFSPEFNNQEISEKLHLSLGIIRKARKTYSDSLLDK